MIDFEKFGMQKNDFLLQVDCFPLNEDKITCTIKRDCEHFIIHSFSLNEFVHRFDFSSYLVSFRPLDVYSFSDNHD